MTITYLPADRPASSSSTRRIDVTIQRLSMSVDAHYRLLEPQSTMQIFDGLIGNVPLSSHPKQSIPSARALQAVATVTAEDGETEPTVLARTLATSFIRQLHSLAHKGLTLNRVRVAVSVEGGIGVTVSSPDSRAYFEFDNDGETTIFQWNDRGAIEVTELSGELDEESIGTVLGATKPMSMRGTSPRWSSC